ncbi:MAG: hypothetical protein AABW80_03470 [Nanoarchaeota archaeon]
MTKEEEQTEVYKVKRGGIVRNVYDAVVVTLKPKQILEMNGAEGYGVFRVGRCNVKLSYVPTRKRIEITGSPEERRRTRTLIEKMADVTLKIRRD